MKSLTLTKTLSILTLGVAALAAGHAQAGWGHDNNSGHGRAFEQSREFSQQINARQQRQMERIQTGRQTGKLTRYEFRELMREQNEIRGMVRHFLADGRIDRREFARIDRAQDIASRNIRDEKQDRQARNTYERPGYHGQSPWYN